MSLTVPLITDRTQADVNHLINLRREIYERTATQRMWDEWNGLLPWDGFSGWFQELRASYTSSKTMNRIGHAIIELDSLVEPFMASFNLNPRIDYSPAISDSEADILSEDDKEYYLERIRILRDGIFKRLELPPVPEDMNTLILQEANDIEIILQKIADFIEEALRVHKLIWVRANSVFSRANSALYMLQGKSVPMPEGGILWVESANGEFNPMFVDVEEDLPMPAALVEE